MAFNNKEKLKLVSLPRDAVLTWYMLWPWVLLCPSHKSAERTELAFFVWDFLWSTLHCVARKFVYLQNNGIFLGNFIPNSGLRKFCCSNSIMLPTKLVTSWVCWSHLRQSTHCWTLLVYYASVDRNAVTLLHQFVLDLLYNLFLQLCSSRHDFHWQSV